MTEYNKYNQYSKQPFELAPSSDNAKHAALVQQTRESIAPIQAIAEDEDSDSAGE
jgi:hypothetical protein